MNRGCTKEIIEKTEKYLARTYDRMPVALKFGRGVWLFDEEGNPYMDMMSGYSALNFGHCHPRLVGALTLQARELAVLPGVFYNSWRAEFSELLADFCSMDKVMIMNSGAEAVEAAIKIARKWGYKVKGVEEGKAEIIHCEDDFHGRTLTVTGLLTVDKYKDGFEPFTLGFKRIPFNDPDALENAITENTVAFLVEPIQGEGGFNVPANDYLRRVRSICRKHNVLLMLDEIPTAFGRTGYDLAYLCEGEEAKPDIIILAKSLGSPLAVSAVVSGGDVMDVMTPGDHGSTFGGSPLACRVAIEAVGILKTEGLSEKAKKLGSYFMRELAEIKTPLLKEVRGRGLFIGVELAQNISARLFCEELLKKGILTAEARRNVVRLTPPLVISREQIDLALDKISETFSHLTVRV